MKTAPERHHRSNEEDKWTRLLQTLIILLILIIGIILLWIFFPQNLWSNKYQEIPINFHSVEEGNYHSDPTQYWNPVVNLSILKEIITELEPESENVDERVNEVLVTLSAPIPTAQSQPTGPGITATTIPVNRTLTPTRRSTSTPISETSALTPTMNLTSSPTQTESIQTRTATPSPNLSATSPSTGTATTTSTITPISTQTNTFTSAPTFTSTSSFTPTFTKSPAPTQNPTNIPTATPIPPDPTKTKKHTQKSTQSSITTPTFVPFSEEPSPVSHDSIQIMSQGGLKSVVEYLLQKMVSIISFTNLTEYTGSQ